jgi:hypothetical protein
LNDQPNQLIFWSTFEEIKKLILSNEMATRGGANEEKNEFGEAIGAKKKRGMSKAKKKLVRLGSPSFASFFFSTAWFPPK